MCPSEWNEMHIHELLFKLDSLSYWSNTNQDSVKYIHEFNLFLQRLIGIMCSRGVNISTRGLLFQWPSTTKIQRSVLVEYNADIMIISMIVTRCCSRIAHLALNNYYSLFVKISLTYYVLKIHITHSMCFKKDNWGLINVILFSVYLSMARL